MNTFRKYARYIILFILFGMLIVSFALWGIGDMLRAGGRSTEVAHVGGTHIPLYGWLGGVSVTTEEVRDRFNRQLEQIQRQQGNKPGDVAELARFGPTNFADVAKVFGLRGIRVEDPAQLAPALAEALAVPAVAALGDGRLIVAWEQGGAVVLKRVGK
mgnify:CR=1 FL=1